MQQVEMRFPLEFPRQLMRQEKSSELLSRAYECVLRARQGPQAAPRRTRLLYNATAAGRATAPLATGQSALSLRRAAPARLRAVCPAPSAAPSCNRGSFVHRIGRAGFTAYKYSRVTVEGSLNGADRIQTARPHAAREYYDGKVGTRKLQRLRSLCTAPTLQRLSHRLLLLVVRPSSLFCWPRVRWQHRSATSQTRISLRSRILSLPVHPERSGAVRPCTAPSSPRFQALTIAPCRSRDHARALTPRRQQRLPRPPRRPPPSSRSQGARAHRRYSRCIPSGTRGRLSSSAAASRSSRRRRRCPPSS
jgi:hypothetical protein